MSKVNIAVVGATGLVGSTVLKVLDEHNVEINKLYLYASSRSKGKIIRFKDKDYEIIELKKENIKDDIDYAIFSAGGSTSNEYAKYFVEKGAIVVDNSSNFRMHDDVPLIVPESNAKDMLSNNGIIANPNCSTIQVIPILKAIDDKYNLKRVIYSTYQAVSGAGVGGINDLENSKKGISCTKFIHPILGNLIPHIDDFTEDNYTKEEHKMINETRKILNKKDLLVTATCVRVPVKTGHSISVNLELENEYDIDDIFKLLNDTKGVIVYDDVKNNKYPMPIEVEGSDYVYVGRIRRDNSVKNGLNLFIVADNIRKGAATNAVQIVMELIKNRK